jgi:hypothetical protein
MSEVMQRKQVNEFVFINGRKIYSDDICKKNFESGCNEELGLPENNVRKTTKVVPGEFCWIDNTSNFKQNAPYYKHSSYDLLFKPRQEYCKEDCHFEIHVKPMKNIQGWYKRR